MCGTVNVLAPAASRLEPSALRVPRVPEAAARRDLAPARSVAAPWAPGPAGGQSAAAFAAAAYVRVRDAWPRSPVPIRDGCDLRV